MTPREVEQRDEEVIRFIERGYSMAQVAKIMNYNSNYIHRLFVRVGADKFWLSPKEQSVIQAMRGIPPTPNAR